MILKNRKGFTLIEILIVVAIIAILASVVLVGLAPTQEAGRDARRVSDLAEVQNGLELYYNSKGVYPIPTTATWGPGSTATTFSGDLINAGIGISSVPNDPNPTKNYLYAWNNGATAYELEATMENASGTVFNNYEPPQGFTVQSETGGTAPTCTDLASSPQYCVSL